MSSNVKCLDTSVSGLVTCTDLLYLGTESSRMHGHTTSLRAPQWLSEWDSIGN